MECIYKYFNSECPPLGLTMQVYVEVYSCVWSLVDIASYL